MTGPWTLALLLAGALLAASVGGPHGSSPSSEPPGRLASSIGSSSPNASALGNLSASLDRLVALIGAGGGAILSIAWARVALSWFSHDVTKKVQAKERARDALIGTLLFTGALSGLVWGLAQWVLTGA